MDETFSLFCAYHLGLFPDGSVRFANLHDVARTFDLGPDQVLAELAKERLDPDSLVHSGFDVASAQVDIQVSPEGVDLRVLAQMHFDAALVARDKDRDWDAELQSDRAANASTFRDEPDS